MAEKALGQFIRHLGVLLFYFAELFLAILVDAGKAIQNSVRDCPNQSDSLAHYHRAERLGVTDQSRDERNWHSA